ncbi:MAG: DUF3109 family protein [Ignavibacteriae bacterium]|nr:DUF3109 family protein [Ignavibacteria bacterium]MBI3364332.1 DUF3109 family protein [Ignavibacteriota bacterium]
MFIIGEAVVEEEIARARFACDLQQCHGACCTLPGGRGAPLDDSELAEIEQAYPVVRKYLSQKHLQAAEQHGLFEGVPGSYATTCIDDRDCMFVYYEQDVARCSLEKAYLNGETAWRKPLSCHLFPIRISSGSVERVRYEKISECAAGRKAGQKHNVPLYEYLKEPLVRKFGEQWYERFREECRQHDEALEHE